ncbi:hypothetical protein Taro_026010 [Colocasia esculenta]|uniref:Retrotransposon gag domain-containing protein n=1 Tax=Colocasia esculenta TaxID=4460 RepID=A0A843V513_COLES|nr:hypothetical protein [Colocasia esculenta]
MTRREGQDSGRGHILWPFRVSGSVGGDRENRVLGMGQGSGSRVVTVVSELESDRTCSGFKLQQKVPTSSTSTLLAARVDMAPRRRRQVRELVEQQGESEMPAQGQVQEEVSAEESVAQPQVAPAAAAAAEQFFRNLYQGVYQPVQEAVGVQPLVPPPVVPEQQVEPEVEQPERQQWSGTGSTQAGRRRTAVMEDRTTLLERFLRLRPPMFSGEYDPDKAESWTHELECIFETMERAEEDLVRLAVYQLKGAAHEWWRVQRQTHFQGQWLDHITWQRFLEVFHGEYFPNYA